MTKPKWEEQGFWRQVWYIALRQSPDLDHTRWAGPCRWAVEDHEGVHRCAKGNERHSFHKPVDFPEFGEDHPRAFRYF